MEYQEQTYFVEHEEPSVKGFTVIDSHEGEYHIAEKWMRQDGGNTWVQYWIPADQLQARVDEGSCEPKATLTDEQYETVCQKIDHDNVVSGVTA